jgi:hypothetical protein
MATVVEIHHLHQSSTQPVPQRRKRRGWHHCIRPGLEDLHRCVYLMQPADGGAEQPLQFMHRCQRCSRVVAVFGGRCRRLLFLDGQRGALEILEHANDADPAVVEAEPGVHHGHPRHRMAGRGQQRDGATHRQASHETAVCAGVKVLVRRFKGAVPFTPARTCQLPPVRAVAGKEGYGHCKSLRREVFCPRQHAERAAGKAMADGDPGPGVGTVAGVAESGRPGRSAAFCHDTIVSLFGTNLTRVGLH